MRGGPAEQGESAGAAAARPVARSCPSSRGRSGRCAWCLRVGKRLWRAGPAAWSGRSRVPAGCAGSGAGGVRAVPGRALRLVRAPSLTTLVLPFGLWAGIAFWSAVLRMGYLGLFILHSPVFQLLLLLLFLTFRLETNEISQEAERPPKEVVLWLGTPFWSQSPGLLFVFTRLTWGAAAFLLSPAALKNEAKKPPEGEIRRHSILTSVRAVLESIVGCHTM